MSTASNHEKAPICAAFVAAMREAFGEIKILSVKEGKVKLGEADDLRPEDQP